MSLHQHQQVPDPHHPRLIMIKLCKRLRNNDPTLTEIKLHGAMVTEEQASNLAEVLPFSTHLKTIDLCMESRGVETLARALAFNRNTSVTCLSFRLCPITEESAIAIAQMLATNTHCQKLHLFFSCLVGIEGIRAIARSLTINKSLSELNLSGSGLGDYGVVILALALRQNSTLRSLNLGHTLTSNVGVQELAMMLESNKSLLKLDLSQTLVKAEGIAALVDVLKERNTTLQHATGYFGNTACFGNNEKDSLEYYLMLNRAGRASLQKVDTSTSLVPLFLEQSKGKYIPPKDNPNTLFGLLRELPQLWTAIE